MDYQRQPAVYNFHTSWCQCNSAGPMTRDNGPCVQFREAVLKPSDTVTGVRALEGYRCSVDNATPARLTSLSSCGWWLISLSPSPSPTVTYYRHRVNLLRLRTRLTRAQDASSWLHLSMVVKLVKRSSVRSSCLKFSTVRNKILDTEKFFQVSSLASLVNIPSTNLARHRVTSLISPTMLPLSQTATLKNTAIKVISHNQLINYSEAIITHHCNCMATK